VVVAKVLLHKPLSASRAADIDADGAIFVYDDVVMHTTFVLLTLVEFMEVTGILKC
jgi:hypothetical protein